MQPPASLAGRSPVAMASTRNPPSPTRSPSKGSIKKKKLERKAKELADRYIREFNDQVGRLEDRDTQQKAFLALIESLPLLDSARVGEVYTLIEKNKKPARSSTRRMLVLLVAVLCRYHPASMSKLLPRVFGYISVRLRDNEARVTDACAILVSAISMHVVAYMVSPTAATSDPQDPEKCAKAFEQVATALLKDANAVGEGAARCMNALIFPTEFDGVSRPPVEASVAHAHRVLPFLWRFLVEAVARMDGSTNYASFSTIFLQLHAACALGNESDQFGAFSGVKECFAPLVESIFEAIEDTFKFAPRDDWVLRKRAIELFALILDTFAMEVGDGTEGAVSAARQYFRDKVERCRALVVAARHDPVSSVRDAAIAAARAFDALDKQCPKTGRPAAPELLYHQVSSYASDIGRGKRHKDRTTDDTADRDSSCVSASPSTETLPFTSSPEDDGDQGAATFEENVGDEASGPATDAADEQLSNTPSVEVLPVPAPPAVESSSIAALADVFKPKRPVARARRAQREPIARLPPPRAKKPTPARRFSPSFEPLADDEPLDDQGEALGNQSDPSDDRDGEPVTGAQAALAAALCGESEMALRLCLVEDDLALLRQTLSLLGTPCLASLSRASRNAVCVALLTLLDGGEGLQSDAWLALEWLDSLVDSRRNCTSDLDPRIRHELADKLADMSFEPTRLALGAARVLERLHLT